MNYSNEVEDQKVCRGGGAREVLSTGREGGTERAIKGRRRGGGGIWWTRRSSSGERPSSKTKGKRSDLRTGCF